MLTREWRVGSGDVYSGCEAHAIVWWYMAYSQEGPERIHILASLTKIFHCLEPKAGWLWLVLVRAGTGREVEG